MRLTVWPALNRKIGTGPAGIAALDVTLLRDQVQRGNDLPDWPRSIHLLGGLQTRQSPVESHRVGRIRVRANRKCGLTKDFRSRFQTG